LVVHVSSLILAALQRAVAEPAGMALVGGRSAPGLFSASAAGKQAAQRCKDDGLLRVVRTEAKGKSPREICALTEQGLQHLLRETSPRPVLDALLRAVERCQTKLDEFAVSADEQREHLSALRDIAVKILAQLPKTETLRLPWEANGQRRPEEAVLDCLRAWNAGRQLGDCPLPELYRRAREAKPSLSLGQYHDALRGLHEKQAIYLHPWTGPLYEMSEPAAALLAGHEIAYYASLRPTTLES
jgi:DNA-binding PadR family transcriptional regulator